MVVVAEEASAVVAAVGLAVDSAVVVAGAVAEAAMADGFPKDHRSMFRRWAASCTQSRVRCSARAQTPSRSPTLMLLSSESMAPHTKA